jgi:hypothetical protein
MDIKNILNYLKNVSSSESGANGRSLLEKPVNVNTLAEISGASGQSHTVTAVDLKKFPHLLVFLGKNIILELDLVNSVERRPLDTYGSESEYEYEYEISSEEENSGPVDTCQTEDTESSETSQSVLKTKSEESEAGAEGTTCTYEDLCDGTTWVTSPSIAKINRDNMDELIADSKLKPLSSDTTEGFTGLSGKIKDLYKRLQKVEAVGKKHIGLIAELERKIASK